jgi:hypothetical protein
MHLWRGLHLHDKPFFGCSRAINVIDHSAIFLSITQLFRRDRLGIDPSKAVLRAPAVKNSQDEQTFNANASIPVKSKKG